MLIAILFSLLIPCAQSEDFKFTLLNEPMTLDPQSAAASSGNYLFHNIYRGLFVYSQEEGLKPEGAKACVRSPHRLTCTLRKLNWSNGEPVTAQNYLDSFRRLIDPDQRSPQANILFALKNARDIWAGRKKPAELGVEAPSPGKLVFYFAQDDPEFEFRLIHPGLSPLPPGGFRTRQDSAQMPVTGPYKITDWKKGIRVRLERNPHYPFGNPQRPAAEAFFVEEDSTTLRLYEAGKLSFVRRLVASDFPRFRGRPDLHHIPMARFDYVGFGPALRDNADARFALAHSLEFDDYIRLFDSRSPAGCPSLPKSYMDKIVCMKADFSAARAKAKDAKPKSLEMHFSQMGGDDIRRAAEWYQGQWKKNLDWFIELKSQEQTVYVASLREQPPPIFRKGVGLDRPTCLAALEIFEKDNPENYIRLDDHKYARLVGRLRQSLPLPARRKACREALEYLLSLNRIIPLGEMYFTILVSPKFKGWRLNELNQLDLSHLHGS